MVVRKTLGAVLCCALVAMVGCTARPDRAAPANPPPEEIPAAAEPEGQRGEPEAEQPAAPPDMRRIEKEMDIGPHIKGIYTAPMRLMEDVFPMHTYTGDGPKEWGRVEYYVDVVEGENGDLMWDDTQLVSLVLQVEDGFFPLISAQRAYGRYQVEVGNVDSAENAVTLVVSCRGGAGYQLLEYRYDPAEDAVFERVFYTLGDNPTYPTHSAAQ